MRFKRTFGLVMGIALTFVPATAAFAKPVTSHQLVVQWHIVDAGVTTNASLQIVIGESGMSAVELQLRQSGIVQCEDGSWNQVSRLLSFDGPANLSTSVDRRLDEIVITGDLETTQTIGNGCVGSIVTSQLVVPIELTGTAVDRPVRSRDHDSGTRFITRLQDVVLSLDGVSITDQGVLTRIIARG